MADPKKKKKAFIFIIVSFWLVIIYLVYFFYYKWSVTQLRDFEKVEVKGVVLPDNPKLSAKQMLNLGWAHTAKDRPNSSYLNFLEKKDSGVVRVGFFGCSFMRGNEVSDSLNIADLLNKKIRSLNGNKIECINFGVGAYGIHQSYLLYEYVGKKYNLDVVVFNAFEWHAERDGTFRFGDFYAYVHSRYVEEDGKLKLMEVIGEDKKDAYRRYTEFYPPYQYLKYDSKCPNFLSPFFAARFNYFFYYKDNYQEMKKEILHTYQLMAEAMLADGKKVIFLDNDEYIRGLQIKNPNFHLAKMYDENLMKINLLYQAPLLHMSGMGNDFRANVLLSEFLGTKDKVPYVVFKESVFAKDVYVGEKVKKSFFSFGDEGQFGTFISNGKTADWDDQKYIKTYDTALAHLLLLGGTYAEPEFAVLPESKTLNDAVIEVQTTDGKKSIIKVLLNSSPYFSVVTHFSPSLDYELQSTSSGEISLNGWLLKFKQNIEIEKAELKIKDKSYPLLFEKNEKGAYKFKMSSALKMRSCNNEYVDVKSFSGDEGVFYYNVLTQSDKKVKIPVFTWKRVWLQVNDTSAASFFKQ